MSTYEKKWVLIERVGDLIYGVDQRWGSRMADDLGISQSHFAMMKAGRRVLQDEHLMAVIELAKRKRAEMLVNYADLYDAMSDIAANLEPGGDVDLGPERALILPETVLERLREMAAEHPDEALDLCGGLDGGKSKEK